VKQSKRWAKGHIEPAIYITPDPDHGSSSKEKKSQTQPTRVTTRRHFWRASVCSLSNFQPTPYSKSRSGGKKTPPQRKKPKRKVFHAVKEKRGPSKNQNVKPIRKNATLRLPTPSTVLERSGSVCGYIPKCSLVACKKQALGCPKKQAGINQS
jgi:hypothetical protein